MNSNPSKDKLEDQKVTEHMSKSQDLEGNNESKNQPSEVAETKESNKQEENIEIATEGDRNKLPEEVIKSPTKQEKSELELQNDLIQEDAAEKNASIPHKSDEEQKASNEVTKQSPSQKTETKSKKQTSEKDLPNVLFYRNKMKSQPNGALIETILKKWKGDYDELEDNHSYIQWLFPNFYGSAFNPHAPKLEEEEAEIFRTDREIALRLVEAYELILDFFGIHLVDRFTGKLERAEHYKGRYKDAFLTYYHNHLRMRRILTHLNNVGFRKYAVELVNFLEREIYGKTANEEGLSPNKSNKDEDDAPLRKLKKVSGALEIWKIYGDHENDPKRIEKLEKNCFAKYPEGFKPSIFFENNNN